MGISPILAPSNLQEMSTHNGTSNKNKKRKGTNGTYQLNFDVTNYDLSRIEPTAHMAFNEVKPMKLKRGRKSSENKTSLNAAAAQSRCGGVMASPQHRRLWVKGRSKAWWEQCNHPDFPESEFKKSFRMSRATFDFICDKLDSAVKKQDTTLRLPIPGRQRVAVCIYRLATGAPLRQVSERFGLGISTCHKLVVEVCQAIWSVLKPIFIKWPEGEYLRDIKHEFESMSKILNIGGSIYTTHIPIIAPKITPAPFLNKRHTERSQKNSYSIAVQGVVDSKGIFSDISIGWPGSLPDDQVLEKSTLYKKRNSGFMKNSWIVGSAGFPLTDWLLVPYTHQNLTWTQHAFNEKITEIQNVSKDSFARLKGRWICLQKRTEVKLGDLLVLIGACCVLHNICEMRGEEMEPGLKFEGIDDEMVWENGVRSTHPEQLRDHIAHNLLHHGSSFL